MQETEFSFSDMLFGALRKWRKAIVFAIVCAILVGAVAAITRVTDMNDPEKVEEWQTYYGEWGARAYLYPGSGESIYNPFRAETLTDSHLWIDGDQFRKMGGRYLFSRYELDNVEELGFELQGVYTEDTSPYTIWLYETGE